MNLKIKKSSFFKIWVYIEVFLTILLSGTPLISVEKYVVFYNSLVVVMCFGGLMSILRSRITKKFLKKLFVVIMVCILLFLINLFNYPSTSETLLYRLIYFICFLLFLKAVYDNEIDIFKVLYKCILVIVLISIFYYIVLHVFNIPLSFNTIITNNNIKYNMYSFLYYENPQSSFTHNLRLSGPFWEPGILQIYINFAVFYCLYIDSKINKKALLFLIISLIICYSTSGYLFCIILFAIKLGFSERVNNKTKFFIAIPAFLIGIITIIYLLYTKKNGLDVDSYNARVSDLLIGLEIFINNIFVGTGFNNLDIYTSITGKNRGNSNGLIQLMYTTGIVGILVYFYPFYYNVKNSISGKKRLSNLVYILFFIFANMTEPLYHYPIMIFLVCNEYIKAFFNMKEGVD